MESLLRHLSQRLQQRRPQLVLPMKRLPPHLRKTALQRLLRALPLRKMLHQHLQGRLLSRQVAQAPQKRSQPAQPVQPQQDQARLQRNQLVQPRQDQARRAQLDPLVLKLRIYQITMI